MNIPRAALAVCRDRHSLERYCPGFGGRCARCKAVHELDEAYGRVAVNDAMLTARAEVLSGR